MAWVSFFGRRGALFWAVCGLLLVLFVGFMDYITGYELSFSLFYLAPVMLVTWFAGRRLGVGISILSAIAWFGADYLSGNRYSIPSIHIWNTLIRFGFFLVVTLLISALHKAYRVNQELVRIDYVTGAISIRHFYDLAKSEMDRFRRYGHPFSLIYIDLDNFKDINDRLGHKTGDRLLRIVTGQIQSQIRPNDSLARLGGDEFALLLPETGEEQIKLFMSRIHSTLVAEMIRNGWLVTFSMGAVTFKHAPKSVDEMIKLADDAMYEIKMKNKNGICYRVFDG